MTSTATVLPYDRTAGDGKPSHLVREMSPKTKARVAAVLFLATIVGGVVAQAAIADNLIVTGDATATASNILANQSLVRIAFMIFMIEMACQTAMTGMFYDLMMPVDRSLARAAAAFGYTGSGIKAMARLFFYAPLFVLGGASYLSVFDAKQLEAIAYLMIRLNTVGTQVAVPFLGIGTIITSYLMLRSTFLPRFLGIIGMSGGAGWVMFWYPPLGSKMFLPIAFTALFGCAVTIGWLLVRGVDENKWHAMAAHTSRSIWR
ncbi:MAG TPA: DUF4386 domain-containing protein [Gemmatimonadaceae bacterium]|nr:DUF4386 domain-containing protein [Gemmatimonadaceae bacterium]